MVTYEELLQIVERFRWPFDGVPSGNPDYITVEEAEAFTRCILLAKSEAAEFELFVGERPVWMTPSA